ncbi:Hypothetical protein EHI5A_029860 [Entamoeba histolytica KU27]|uniref:Uncharacterized protein n=1 Tax=Entamoeba histolytica KU27 TaxID=885311 RepID=M2Q533_ENTHI|nr:Hypothetical protein EHI5A_029860 [Entamoeba histolytica KU27]
MYSLENIDGNSSVKGPVPCHCLLCQKSEISEGQDLKMKTTKLCVMILKSLKLLKPENEFFSLKNDIKEFITNHWPILSKLKQFKTPNWRKALLDAFNHCNLIESGKDVCHNRGYYKLKDHSKQQSDSLTSKDINLYVKKEERKKRTFKTS